MRCDEIRRSPAPTVPIKDGRAKVICSQHRRSFGQSLCPVSGLFSVQRFPVLMHLKIYSQAWTIAGRCRSGLAGRAIFPPKSPPRSSAGVLLQARRADMPVHDVSPAMRAFKHIDVACCLAKAKMKVIVNSATYEQIQVSVVNMHRISSSPLLQARVKLGFSMTTLRRDAAR
jgi:hypothetical protein